MYSRSYCVELCDKETEEIVGYLGYNETTNEFWKTDTPESAISFEIQSDLEIFVLNHYPEITKLCTDDQTGKCKYGVQMQETIIQSRDLSIAALMLSEDIAKKRINLSTHRITPGVLRWRYHDKLYPGKWKDYLEEIKDDSAEEGCEYIYYFYTHLSMSLEEEEKILNIIQSHDYDAFMELYRQYNDNEKGLVYFPDEIAVFDENDEVIRHISVLEKENFMLITDVDCECG